MHKSTTDKRSPLPHLLALCAAALLGLWSGCPPTIPPFAPGTVKPAQLPDDVKLLLTFARKQMVPKAAGEFSRLHHVDALVALEKARSLAPGNLQVLLLGAKVSSSLGERARGRAEQFKYAEMGLKFTRLGRRAFPRVAAFHYYHAALMGLRVDAYRASAMSGVPEIRAAASQALKLDPTFEHGGPLRILGSLLASVPATAPFHGDVEKGTNLLLRAVKVAPDFPLNHYLLAQAYAKDDEADLAAPHLRKVLCAASTAQWDRVIAAKYAALARKGLRALGKSVPPSCK